MKIGFASGHIRGTGAVAAVEQQQQQAKELQIMNCAISIKKGKPVYTRRSLWELVKIA